MSVILISIYHIGCTDGDSRLVNSNNGVTTIIALNALDQTETCQSIINITKTTCNTSWSNVIEGRVEVCQDKVFGTVCDNRWDIFDARVICRQLRANSDGKFNCNFSMSKYYIILNCTIINFHVDVIPIRRSSMVYGEAINTSIILSDLNCDGSEDNLLSCSKSTREGGGTCDHSEDAGVKCGGK